MLSLRRSLALPLALAASIASAHASSIRDNAGLFDPDAVQQAKARLNEIERESRIQTTIETIDSLGGANLQQEAIQLARESRTDGIFILISKADTKIEVLASKAYQGAINPRRRVAIRDAFVQEFKKRDFNAGLRSGVEVIESEVTAAQAANGGTLRANTPAVAPGAGARPAQGRGGFPAGGRGGGQPSFGIGSLLTIGLIILAVLFGIRLLGNLFGAGNRGGYAGQGRPMGMGGPGQGAPGYGAPGYGGGGGFMSSMFGGIGGALAGNWLYDQFSGRHHGGSVDSSSYGTGAGTGGDFGGTETGGSDWAGTGGASWGDDAGTGGGGDWGGGGGGDWAGGGGGDWGGGDGGGDWS